MEDNEFEGMIQSGVQVVLKADGAGYIAADHNTRRPLLIELDWHTHDDGSMCAGFQVDVPNPRFADDTKGRESKVLTMPLTAVDLDMN
jgi:hypothetical protein